MRRNLVSGALILLATVFMVACGGDGFLKSKLPSNTPTVTISVSPATANVRVGATAQFTATITGTTNSGVSWTVSGGAANGTISTSGLYTAPATVPSPAAVTITATAAADTTKTATATVTVLPAVSVSVSPTSADVQISTQKKFTASVSNATDTGVTWSVTGTGCTGASCGTIDTTGLYTAPAEVPNPATVTVKATSKEDTSKSASATVTITAPLPITVTVAPKTATVSLNHTQQFNATVANDDSGVNWRLSSSSCSDEYCGTISSSGLYTAPAAMPPLNAPSPITRNYAYHSIQITVTATSVANSNISDTATITLTDQPPSSTLTEGQYAFYYSGYDNNHNEVARVGVFVVDADGKMAGGIQDTIVAGASPETCGLSSNSSYTLESYMRGILKLDCNGTITTYAYSYNGDGSGRLIEYDAAGAHGAGRFVKQNAGAYETLAGDYVIAATGSGKASTGDIVSRASAVFRMSINGTTDNSIVQTDGQLAVTGFPFANGPLQAGSVGDISQRAGYGRTILSLTSSGSLGTFTVPVYMYSADEGFVIGRLDTHPVTVTGNFTKQVGNGHFTRYDSLNSKIIFQGAGFDGGSATHTFAGIVDLDGAGSLREAGSMLDRNYGTPASSPTAAIALGGSYTVSANGKGAMTLTNGSGGATLANMIFVLTGPNKGYFIESGSGSATDAFMGTFEPQAAVGDLFGTYFITSTMPTMPGQSMTLGTLKLCDSDHVICSPAMGLDGTADVDDAGALSSLTITGSYTALALGRGTADVVVNDSTQHVAIYPVSPTKMYVVILDPDELHETIMVIERGQLQD